MTEHFTKRFVHHRGIGLAPQRITEFPFHHGECGFDVGTFVVVLQELFSLELKVVEHLLPHCTSGFGGCVVLVNDKRSAASRNNRVCVLVSAVSFVSRNFGDGEMFGRMIDHWSEEWAVTRTLSADFDSRNDVRFDSAHDMGFNPIGFFPQPAIFVVIPAGETGSAEAGRVHSKVGFDGLQGQAALSNQVAQNGSQSFVLKVVENRVVVRNTGDETLCVSLPQIAHESPRRHGGIDLECCGENNIRERQGASATALIGGLWDSRAEVVQEFLEFILLIGLSRIVGRPILRICFSHGSHADGFRHSSASVRVFFALQNVSDREDVLAILVTEFKIRARAGRLLPGNLDQIFTGAALRWYEPSVIVPLNNCFGCRQHQTSLLPCVHNQPLSDWYITIRYICCQVKYLTEFLNGISSEVWQGSHYKVFSVSGVNIFGFPGKTVPKNPRYVRVVNRRTGIRLASRTAKRQSEGKLVRCCNQVASQGQHKTLEFERQNAVKWPVKQRPCSKQSRWLVKSKSWCLYPHDDSH